MKVALVHDYLIDFGGAERVLLALHEIYPKAPIYVSILDKKALGKHWNEFRMIDIRTSWFNNLPFASKLISPLRFLLPLIWKSIDLSDYDLIIDSSSWAITRGFKSRSDQIEICYCHTPPRYLYGYDTSRSWKNKWYGGFIRAYALVVNHLMRMYDWNTSQKVDYFITNSKNVAARVQKFYRRDSQVIYPPVVLAHFGSESHFRSEQAEYYLAGGRLVAAKNFDLIIKACKKSRVKLKIFGTGVLENTLKKLVNNKDVEFLGNVSDSALANYYKNAKAFIVAQKDEDFGITTVESQGYGTPVIAYRGGGYLESVIEKKTGVFFDELTTDSLSRAITKFNASKIRIIEAKDCIKNAKKFSKEKFKDKVEDFINLKLKIKSD